jgi:carbon storage regulator
MLVLTRKPGEEIMIGDEIRLQVSRVYDNEADLRFYVPSNMAVKLIKSLEGDPNTAFRTLGMDQRTRGVNLRRRQRVVIGDEILVTITYIRAGIVRVGIDADRSIPVHRYEVYCDLQNRQNNSDATTAPSAADEHEPVERTIRSEQE